MFDIGQQVICAVAITDNALSQFHRAYPEYPLKAWPIKGCVYTIRDIEREGKGLYLRLEEIINPKIEGDEVRFCSRYFRPVRKTSIDVFTRMLAPTDREREMV